MAARKAEGLYLLEHDPQPWRGKTIGLYPRLSEDPDETREGIDRQTDDCTREAYRLGAAHVVLYVERDKSAYKRQRVPAIDPATGEPTTVLRVVRPVWSRMMRDLQTGVIDGAMAYNLDRLLRDPRDLEDTIDIVQKHRRLVKAATGLLDLLTEEGINAARLGVAMAWQQSAATGRRVRRAHRSRADKGLPVVRGAGQRAFGYTQSSRELVATEAAAIRNAVAQILDGATIADVVRDWNKAGMLTVGGKQWRWQHVWGVLSNPRIAGYRSTIVNGDPEKKERATFYAIHTDPDGREVKATWVDKDEQGAVTARGEIEPIIDRDTFDRLQVAIGAVTVSEDGEVLRKKRTERNGKPSQLLVGLLFCGVCGSRMYVQSYTLKHTGERSFRYYCPPASKSGKANRTQSGCVSINGPALDYDIVLRYAAALTAGRAATPVDEATAAKLAAVDEQLTALGRQLDAGVIDVPTWAEGKTRLRVQRADLLITAATTKRSTDPRAARRALEAFDKGSMEMKRRLLSVWAAGGIHVRPAKQRGQLVYDRERVFVDTEVRTSSAATA